MGVDAISKQRGIMHQMQDGHCFKRWLTIPVLWEPDFSLLFNYGTLANVDNKLGPVARRVVRCSPQLAAFIEPHTQYKMPMTGPDLEAGPSPFT